MNESQEFELNQSELSFFDSEGNINTSPLNLNYLNLIPTLYLKFDIQTPKSDTTSDIGESKSKLSPLFKIIKVKNKTILENEINELFKKMNIIEKDFFLNLNNNCKEIEKIRNKLKLNKKRTKKLVNELNLIKPTKRGRKKKDDFSKGDHNKYSPDIIIKAIKTKINASLILFLNKIINRIYNFDQITFYDIFFFPKMITYKAIVTIKIY